MNNKVKIWGIPPYLARGEHFVYPDTADALFKAGRCLYDPPEEEHDEIDQTEKMTKVDEPVDKQKGNAKKQRSSS